MPERLPRWIYWVLSFIGGVVIAAILTGIHQLSVTLFGVAVPWGLIVALIVLTAYFVAIRLLAPSRWPVILAALGSVLIIALFSLHGPGGSLIIPGNLAGFIWAYAPLLLAAIVIIWPKLHDREPAEQNSAAN